MTVVVLAFVRWQACEEGKFSTRTHSLFFFFFHFNITFFLFFFLAHLLSAFGIIFTVLGLQRSLDGLQLRLHRCFTRDIIQQSDSLFFFSFFLLVFWTFFSFCRHPTLRKLYVSFSLSFYSSFFLIVTFMFPFRFFCICLFFSKRNKLYFVDLPRYLVKSFKSSLAWLRIFEKWNSSLRDICVVSFLTLVFRFFFLNEDARMTSARWFVHLNMWFALFCEILKIPLVSNWIMLWSLLNVHCKM